MYNCWKLFYKIYNTQCLNEINFCKFLCITKITITLHYKKLQ